MMQTPAAQALIALGANIGDARTTVARAIKTLCDGREVSLVARSSDYRTPPWGVTNQPCFINAAIRVETSLTPQELMQRGQTIEQEFGRDREKEQRWGPRVIDIDLIAYDDMKIDAPELTLPHPRLFERAFVLVPLDDVAPDWTINGMTIRQALTRVDASGIEKLSGTR